MFVEAPAAFCKKPERAKGKERNIIKMHFI